MDANPKPKLRRIGTQCDLQLLTERGHSDLTIPCEPQHGYAIARTIKEQSGATLLVEEGSLYPALHRLVRLKHVTAEWGTSENNRKARFYRITPAGRKRLAADADLWRRVSSAVTAVLDGADLRPGEGRTACSA